MEKDIAIKVLKMNVNPMARNAITMTKSVALRIGKPFGSDTGTTYSCSKYKGGTKAFEIV